MQDIRVILQIEDDFFVEEVIRPLQRERKLSKVLVELLKAYHKDDYVNASATISLENKEISSREDLLKSLKGMRENVEALEFLNEETKNLSEDGIDIFSTVVSKNEEDVKEEPKMLESKNFVTREEFEALVKGQNEILKLLKSGSLLNRVKDSQRNNTEDAVSAEQEESQVEKEEVKSEIKEIPTEQEELISGEETDGSSIAESLLAGMDFNF